MHTQGIYVYYALQVRPLGHVAGVLSHAKFSTIYIREPAPSHKHRGAMQGVVMAVSLAFVVLCVATNNLITAALSTLTVRARPGRLVAIRVFHSKSVLSWRFCMGATDT